MPDIHAIIAAAMEQNPSDIHLSVGIEPVCRVNGLLQRLPFAPCSRENLEEYLQTLLSLEEYETLQRTGDLDVSLTPDSHRAVRMRLNAYRQRGSYSMALRVLNQEIPSFEELGVPRNIAEGFCKLHHGLVLVTGPTGTGKTTTISSMIDWINHNRSCHVITIEDPIEYFHKHNRSIIHQRETGTDTKNFKTALRAALREDPDVLFIGEMRDLESVSTALTAAETGHLVFSTLHTVGTAKTIDRIIDVFPTNQQQQVRVQLALALEGIISQQLLISSDGTRREMAAEIMLATPAIRNLIRENRSQQIENSIITGAAQGMRTMDASLALLVKQGKVALEEARGYATAPEQFDLLVRRGTQQA